jgi:uncharacterized membrane protein YgcG
MRTAVNICALVLLAIGTASAATGASAPATPAAFGLFAPGTSSATYVFNVSIERPQRPFDGDGPPGARGYDDANASPRPSPTPMPPQTIRFDTIDATHVRLTVVDPSATAPPDSLVADRDADGTLHAKFKRGSRWALPVAIYDRLTTLAQELPAVQPGPAGGQARLQPIVSNDQVYGKLVATRTGPQLKVEFTGTGDVTPSSDLLPARPSGGNRRGGFGGGGMGGGGMGGGGMGGGGFGGHRGGGGGDDERGDADRKSTATIDLVAEFDGSTLTRAASAESLDIGGRGFVADQHWSVVRVP